MEPHVELVVYLPVDRRQALLIDDVIVGVKDIIAMLPHPVSNEDELLGQVGSPKVTGAAAAARTVVLFLECGPSLD